MKKMQTVKITRAEADKAKPHHDVLKDLAKEKKQALKIMGITYETSRDPQTEVEELYKRAYSHLGRWHAMPAKTKSPTSTTSAASAGPRTSRWS